MVVEYYDKFEYKYAALYSSLENSIRHLNLLGVEGWEVIKIIDPKSTGEQYKALLKRKLIVQNI